MEPLVSPRDWRMLVSSWWSRMEEGRAKMVGREEERAASSGVNEAALLKRILGDVLVKCLEGGISFVVGRRALMSERDRYLKGRAGIAIRATRDLAQGAEQATDRDILARGRYVGLHREPAEGRAKCGGH